MTHNTDTFASRHIGPRQTDIPTMLHEIGAPTLDALIAQTIPAEIGLNKPLSLNDAPMSEHAYLQHIEHIAQKNALWHTYIGMGYYATVTPSVIRRCVFENPGWYTQYTPYQAEIAQGRLEALLNFQTMVADLTGMNLANASLLDEATAAAEAMLLLFRSKNKNTQTPQSAVFLVADACQPLTIELLRGRAEPLGIELLIASPNAFVFSPNVFGCLLQYPSHDGAVYNYAEITQQAHHAGAEVAVIADLLSLVLLTPPGEWGADIVLGSAQRFGVPLGYGGPHAAFFAVAEKHARQLPGRVIGVSLDKNGKTAYRMALQTREQHIRRDKATSNICTAQALLAIMASMYGIYHSPRGLKNIAQRIHSLTVLVSEQLTNMGYQQTNAHFFDTLLIDLRQHTQTSGLRVRRVAESEQVNFRYFDHNTDFIGISLDETSTIDDVRRIVEIFAQAINVNSAILPDEVPQATRIPDDLCRKSAFMTHPVFNTHRSETEMMRYIKHLENKDLSLTHAMIPLGSCTMKLNAASELYAVSNPLFSQLHPFVPKEQAAGYRFIFETLEKDLCQITGFAACSLQPNSGAQGEYAGLMVIRAYHRANAQPQRTVALIPSSAHGTNPASAVIAGMQVVVVRCDEKGNIDLNDLNEKAEQYANVLSCLMVTYPSTHGVFETNIKQICQKIHQHGGLVYMDGANMNAQVGLTSPANIGADVCHLNLHKTFSIPHGGGGPGMGPICVAAFLAPFLPRHRFKPDSTEQGILPVSGSPWGSASILLISYAYIKMLGAEGVTNATRIAILNANYIKKRLETAFTVLYVGEQGRVAHELIIDLRPFKQATGIEAEDVAKRLMDYGFHAPTVSFPVAGTMMIEPTESESKEEIDRFCDAMLSIRAEIAEIEQGNADAKDNVLKNAPHPAYELTADNWNYPYSRKKAGFPLPYLQTRKFWLPIARINNVYGDRNLVCSCPPLESYE